MKGTCALLLSGKRFSLNAQEDPDDCSGAVWISISDVDDGVHIRDTNHALALGDSFLCCYR